MKISKKTQYAIRILADIAINSNGINVPLKDIVARQEFSLKYAEQILATLCRTGLLRSNRGPQGGYKLVKELYEYKIGDIMRAIEGDLAPIPCLSSKFEICHDQESCATVDFWKGYYKAVTDYVDNVTLEELVKNTKEILPCSLIYDN